MTLEQQIIEEYLQHGVMSGKELIVRSEAALSFINACDRIGLAIVGIEGFTISDQQVMPHLDMIADFSDIKAMTWDEYKRASLEAARNFETQFLSRHELGFNFVLLEEREWKGRLLKGK